MSELEKCPGRCPCKPKAGGQQACSDGSSTLTILFLSSSLAWSYVLYFFSSFFTFHTLGTVSDFWKEFLGSGCALTFPRKYVFIFFSSCFHFLFCLPSFVLFLFKVLIQHSLLLHLFWHILSGGALRNENAQTGLKYRNISRVLRTTKMLFNFVSFKTWDL